MYQLLDFRNLISVISYQLSVISYQLSVISYQESGVRRLLLFILATLPLPHSPTSPLPHFPTSPLPHFPTSQPLTPNPLFLLLNCFLNHKKI
ncbi:MAG: hypothetical protein EWV84_22090 [Microcystis sp. M_QC_C_20170808_M3Col]|nr:MAG: hypothetical protein EWV84_22090 [Microcystis sp. M_QC_C_20170808_M3Col]